MTSANRASYANHAEFLDMQLTHPAVPSSCLLNLGDIRCSAGGRHFESTSTAAALPRPMHQWNKMEAGNGLY